MKSALSDYLALAAIFTGFILVICALVWSASTVGCLHRGPCRAYTYLTPMNGILVPMMTETCSCLDKDKP